MMSRSFFWKKMLQIVVCLIGAASICGCSLAAGPGDGAQARDRLIGGMITREPIEKTYASIEREDGKLKNLEFDGIKGHYAVYEMCESQNGQPVYTTLISDGMDVSPNYSVLNEDGKENNTIELKMQAYILPDLTQEKSIAYLNPIYMTPDGEIYTVAGNSGSLSNDAVGASMGWNVNKTEKLEVGNWKREAKVVVSVNCILAEEPVKISICQMDADHKMMKKDEYDPKEVSKLMAVEEGCEYVMILTEYLLEDGKAMTERQAISYDGYTTYIDENVEEAKEEKASLVKTDYTEETGFVLKHSLWILWP